MHMHEACTLLIVLICRYVKDMDCYEDCLGVFSTSSTTSQTLYTIVKDVLLRLNIDFSKCRGW